MLALTKKDVSKLNAIGSNPECLLRFSVSQSIKVIFIGAQVEVLLGSQSEGIHLPSFDFLSCIHQDDQEQINHIFDAPASDGVTVFNFRIRQKSGQIKCLKGSWKKYSDSTGDVILDLLLQDAVSLIEDVVDHTLLSNFTAMMETTDDYIYFKDRNHVFTGASQTLVSVTDPSEHWTNLIGLTDYDVFPEEYADKYYRLEKMVFSGEIEVAHEIQPTLDNNGKKGWIDNRKYPIKDANGKIVGLFGIARDITPLKNAKDELRDKVAQLEQSRRIFDEAGDPILILKNGAYVECNNAAWVSLGYPDKDSFLAQSPVDLSAVDQSDEEKLNLKFKENAQLAMSDGLHRFEWQHQHLNGDVVDVEVTLTAINIDGEKILHVHWRDITERKQMLDTMSWQAMHDTLTELPNRALLTDRFEQAMYQVNRRNSRLVVCMIDLDNFKPVNDYYGHEIGDRLLIEVAARMKQMIRHEDTVARLGGDEFVLLLTDIEKGLETEAVLQRILASISNPYQIADHHIEISASMGVVIYPDDKVDADTLLRHADHAMYRAKQAGRNCVNWFNVVNEQQTVESQEVLTQVRYALKNDELRLYYQPKVNMSTGEIIGMEALIRWLHPEKGLIPPLQFLPVVEKNDLIIDIGEWVFETALLQLESWQTKGCDWSVSVNIAARHFQVPGFLPRLKNILALYPNVDYGRLEIEIVETMAIGDIEHVRSLILACQNELGVRFSLDDFGTGYSSLSYLKQLPADTLKIDQTFVRDILHDKNDKALVEAVIGLARIFERDVIAEGVETIEHGLLLLALGCELAQGYGIAKPMPADEVIPWSQAYQVDSQWLGFSDNN